MNFKKIIEKFWEMYNMCRGDELDYNDPGRVNPGLVDTTIIGADLDVEADPSICSETLDSLSARDLKKQEEELEALKDRLALLQQAIDTKTEWEKEYGSIPPSEEKILTTIQGLYDWTSASMANTEDKIRELTKKEEEVSLELSDSALPWKEGEMWLDAAKKLVRSQKTTPKALISRLRSLQKRRFHVVTCEKCKGTGLYGSGPAPCMYCTGTGLQVAKIKNEAGKEVNWTFQVAPFPFTHWAAIRWLIIRELAKRTNISTWNTLANQAEELIKKNNVIERLNTSNSDKAYEVLYDPSAAVWGTIGCGKNMDEVLDRKRRYMSMYRPEEEVPIEIFFHYENEEEVEQEELLPTEMIEEALLIKLYADTKSYRAVGRLLGMPKTTVTRRVKKAFQSAREAQ